MNDVCMDGTDRYSIARNPLVYIIIVNWNGWRDTVECLESVFRIGYPEFRVIVCDNGSTDGSTERIREWAAGELSITAPSGSNLRFLTEPPVRKPIPILDFDWNSSDPEETPDAPLVLIRTGSNLGFAGGNNVGLQFAMARGDFGYAWLLNNDTVVKTDSLNQLVERMCSTPEAGVCGSTLLYYDAPDTVQGMGGATYNRWFGIARPIGFLETFITPPDRENVENRMSYVIGASMLVSRSFLDEVGMMNKEYFLFFEEIDWVVRAEKRFRLAYAPGSIVYHKEGRSGGINSDPAQKSVKADYFLTRNKILFSRKYFPWTLPTIYLSLVVTVINRIRRGQRERVRMILDIMLHPGKHAAVVPGEYK